MSYAARLAAMSRGHVPPAPPRALGGDAEPPREEIVETEVQPPRTAASFAPIAARPAPRAEAPPPVAAAPHPRGPAATAVSPEPDAPALAAPTTRETIERHTIVEAAPPAPRRAPLPPLPAPASPPVALPPQAQWLAEDTAAADPLVAGSDGDALRELMRSVRQWTSSAPTVIEQHHHEETTQAAAAPQPVAVTAETQVSIGNITITVDDAPVAASRPSATPPRAASDRMARNHIRGG
jgi:hypothetical protein